MDKAYCVKAEVTMTIVVDEMLIPDDDFRRDFYDMHTQEELVEHIAYTALMGFKHVEGLYPEQHRLIRSIDRTVESVTAE